MNARIGQATTLIISLFILAQSAANAQTMMLTGSARRNVTGVNTPLASSAVLTPEYAPSGPRDRAIYRSRLREHPIYRRDNRTFWQRHPMVKGTTIGAGVGAGVGAATGLITHRGVVRGALIGGGAGAGVGAIRTSRIMARHPIARDVATGTVAGLGVGLAAGRHHLGTKGALVGAAAGLGVGLFNHLH